MIVNPNEATILSGAKLNIIPFCFHFCHFEFIKKKYVGSSLTIQQTPTDKLKIILSNKFKSEKLDLNKNNCRYDIKEANTKISNPFFWIGSMSKNSLMFIFSQMVGNVWAMVCCGKIRRILSAIDER